MSLGSPSIQERIQLQSVVLKTLARRIASTLRCGLPGIITAFDSTTQYAHVQLTIFENVMDVQNGGANNTIIPELHDVLVMFPGGVNWCLTFPNLVGAECYVCFADMCINAWSTYGISKDSNGHYVPRKQEIVRRHDLSDGFAILAPRSQPNKIQNYSTTDVELRSMDNHTKISMDSGGNVKLTGDGMLVINGNMGIPVGGTTTPTHMALPVSINGTRYYIWMSTAP